jgi:hypothetical protein
MHGHRPRLRGPPVQEAEVPFPIKQADSASKAFLPPAVSPPAACVRAGSAAKNTSRGRCTKTGRDTAFWTGLTARRGVPADIQRSSQPASDSMRASFLGRCSSWIRLGAAPPPPVRPPPGGVVRQDRMAPPACAPTPQRTSCRWCVSISGQRCGRCRAYWRVTDMTATTAHQPSQPRGVRDVTSSRSRRAARPALWSGPLPALRPFSVQISPTIGQIGLQCRETAVRLERSGPAMVSGEGQLGDIG